MSQEDVSSLAQKIVRLLADPKVALVELYIKVEILMASVQEILDKVGTGNQVIADLDLKVDELLAGQGGGGEGASQAQVDSIFSGVSGLVTSAQAVLEKANGGTPTP